MKDTVHKTYIFDYKKSEIVYTKIPNTYQTSLLFC